MGNNISVERVASVLLEVSDVHGVGAELRNEELSLICKAREGDTHAQNILMGRYRTLIERIAYGVTKGAFHGLLQRDDLVQEGRLGLLDAVARYEASSNCSFRTFASHRIQGSMLDALREVSGRSRSLTRAVREAKRVRLRLSHVLLREPTLGEWKRALPEDLQGKFEEIRMEAAHYQGSTSVLNDENEDVDDSYNSLLVSVGSPESELLAKEASARHASLCQIFSEATEELLDWTEREIIRLRYLVPEEKVLTLDAISRRLEISEGRVCQIESAALGKLRRYLRSCHRGEVEYGLGRLIS